MQVKYTIVSSHFLRKVKRNKVTTLTTLKKRKKLELS